MPLEETGFVLATLFIALIALLLVLAARRDAKIIRSQAIREADLIREEISKQRAELIKKAELLESREVQLNDRSESVESVESDMRIRVLAVQESEAEVSSKLHSIADLTRSQARDEIFSQIRNEEQQYIRGVVGKRVAKAHRESTFEARRVLADAMSRMAVASSAEQVIEAFVLDSEDLKGRIIGKEGRNIRTFEAVAGVDLIIEDDSNIIKISSFDSERRNIARAALESLLKGGMVTPARIEIELGKARESVSARIAAAGYDALEQVGISHMAHPLVEQLGQLKFRTSYTQNVLDHSVETALIAGMLADEIGADSDLTRRAGLLHDLGKSVTPAVHGSHASLGAELALANGESAAVVNAIAAHHGEVEVSSIEAVLVQIADAISAARPGARNEDPANYINRMEQIEKVVLGHDGVLNAVVYSAGRQVRVMVESSQVSDEQLETFVQDLSEHLESVIAIPGEMEITVIRERRSSRRIG